MGELVGVDVGNIDGSGVGEIIGEHIGKLVGEKLVKLVEAGAGKVSVNLFGLFCFSLYSVL